MAPEDKYILIVQQDREKEADDGEKPSDSATWMCDVILF